MHTLTQRENKKKPEHEVALLTTTTTTETEEVQDAEAGQAVTKKRQLLHLYKDIQDEQLKVYMHYVTGLIILYSQIFLCIYVILFIVLGVSSRSNFYWVAYSIIPGWKFLSSLIVLFKRDSWSSEDTRSTLRFNCSDLLSGLTSYQTNLRPFTTWLSYTFLLFVLSMLLIFKSGLMWRDATFPPTNTSSCTTEYNSVTGNAYNPYGFFGILTANYSDQYMGKFCPMDQYYAFPNLFTYITGFLTSPLISTSACSHPLPPNGPGPDSGRVNGYVDTGLCRNATTSAYSAYQSPVLGIMPPITAGTRNSPTVLCKGNTADTICISADGSYAYESNNCSSNYRVGKPRKICPVCLNAWRRMSGDHIGPLGYSHCLAYDEFADDPWFCYFCPGRGYGAFADEVYTVDQLQTNLVITIVFPCLLFLEMIICKILVASMIPDLSYSLNQNRDGTE